MNERNRKSTHLLIQLFLFFLIFLTWPPCMGGINATRFECKSITAVKEPKRSIDWSKEIIYFILIDRFCNGDTTNDYGNNPESHVPFDPQRGNYEALKTYQGGDLAGVLDKIDYLDSLGVTTLWLSPVYDNSDTDFMGWWPYHGYHPIDFYSVDEHFGTLELLKRVVETAHSRNMRVLLDIITNHVAPDHPWITDSQFWHEEGYRHWFHPHSGVDESTSITDWTDQWQLENRELNGLPDLDQDNEAVYAYLLDVAKFWIKETKCDGFRLDAVKHISKSFWQRFCRDIHEVAGKDFLLLGEVFSGDTPYVAGYRDLGFNALFDIPLYYTLTRVFAQGSSISLLSDQVHQSSSQFKSITLSPLLDNHDVPRFLHWADERKSAKLKSALTFVWSLNGIPTLYYGTEVPLPGAAMEHETTGEGQDYLNRYPMPWNTIDIMNSDIFSHIQNLNHLRRSNPALHKGRMVEIYKDFGVYSFLKYTSEQAFLFILNNSSYKEQRSIYLNPDIFPAGTSLMDMDTRKLLYIESDTLAVSLKSLSTLILKPSPHLNSDVLDATSRQCPMSPTLTRDFHYVTLNFRPHKPVTMVTIAGDFNGWNPRDNPLQYNVKRAIWSTRIALKRGRYRYKFVINESEWIADPDNPRFERDPYGGKNSVLVVE